MSGIKGMKRYPQGIKEKIILEYNEGVSQRELSNKYSISRYAIQSWIGARPEKIHCQNFADANQQKHYRNTNTKTND